MNHLPSLWRRNAFTGKDPVREMTSLQREAERLFEDFLNPFDRQVIAAPAVAFEPSCDIEETDSHFLMSFDLPGIKKEDLKIELQDNVLKVSGERKEEREEKTRSRYRSERFHGQFERAFGLPATVKADQVEAHYADGVLRIAVPKTDVTKTQSIKLNEGKTGFWERVKGSRKEEPKSISTRSSDRVA